MQRIRVKPPLRATPAIHTTQKQNNFDPLWTTFLFVITPEVQCRGTKPHKHDKATSPASEFALLHYNLFLDLPSLYHVTHTG